MELNEIRAKFRNRVRVDIKDVDIALIALPFVVKEYDALEREFIDYKKQIEHLTAQFNKLPPPEKKGKRGDASWLAKVEEKKNRLYVELKGKYDYKTTKVAVNAALSISARLRHDFNMIINVSNLLNDFDRKALFQLRKMLFNFQEIGMNKCIYTNNDRTKAFEQLVKSELGDSRVHNVSSVEEAEAILENVVKFLKV